MPDYLVAREDDLDFLAPDYRALHGRSDATLFQDPVWLERLYSTLAPSRRARRAVVTIRRAADGHLVGVLPLARFRRWGVRRVTMADLGVCDHAAPVLDREHAAALVADPVVCRGIRTAIGPFDLLEVERLTDVAATRVLLGASTTRRHSYATHAIPLPATSEAWPDTVLDPTMVRRLEQKRKRLRPKGGATLRVVDDPAEVDHLMERMRGFRRDRFADRRAVDLMQEPAYFEFYRQAAHDGVARGGPARLSVLDVGGEPAAITLDLVDREQHVFVLVGYDVVRLRNCSLGLVVVDELVRAAIAEGQHTFDLTVGDEPYKADFGARPTPMHSIRVAATVRGRAAAAVGDLDVVARRHAKRALAAWADRPWLRRQLPATR